MSDGNKNITFTNIMGQGRINQLGGVFINGRPLPQHIRIKIIEMASNGIKPCHISRQLRVSHGAVSKILNRYVETGSVSPGQIGGNPRSRLAIQAVEKHILALKAKCPSLCASELRSCLIEQEICSAENAPTVSSINRHIRSKKLNNSNDKERKVTKKNQLSHSIEQILGLQNGEDDGPETSEASYSEGEGSGDKRNGNASDDGNCGKNGRVRRNRTSFSSEQLEIMEAAFNTNTYPDQDERERIAIKTGLSEDKIMTWFSNRRARCRKNFAFTGTNSLLIQNAAPISVMPRPSMRQSETVPLFPSQMNLLSYPVSPTSPVKFQDPSTAPILFYPQYASI
uniref:Homeobox domain-containing protein n=2 Tax=Wuchereria bancrofti TaxID=6293 RepID=A0AAF5PXI9_WUCBA